MKDHKFRKVAHIVTDIREIDALDVWPGDTVTLLLESSTIGFFADGLGGLHPIRRPRGAA